MLRVANVSASVEIRDQLEMEKIICELKNKGYKPLIRNMILSLSELTNFQFDEETITEIISFDYRYRRYRDFPLRHRYLGDIFFANKTVYIMTAFRSKLMISAISNTKVERHLQEFCAEVESSIKARLDERRGRDMKFEWNPVSLSYFKFLRRGIFFDDAPVEEIGELSEEIKMKNPDYSEEEAKAAYYLIDNTSRQFITRLAKLGKIFEKDALNFVNNNQTVITKLIDLGLIKEEYLITCKKTQQTLAVIPNKNLINPQYKCSYCGLSFAEENIQKIYSLTEKGKKILDGSRWMYIWITEILIRNGVNKNNIKWNIESGGEEIDIIVEDFDTRIIFELKDREFGLGDAYPFAYRLSRYEGDLGIIITMDKISKDAKKFFHEEMKRSDLNIEYIEGPESINEKMHKIIEKLVKDQINKLISPFSSIIGLNFFPIIINKLEDIKTREA